MGIKEEIANAEENLRRLKERAGIVTGKAEAYADDWLTQLAAWSKSYLVVYPVITLAIIGAIFIVRWIFS